MVNQHAICCAIVGGEICPSSPQSAVPRSISARPRGPLSADSIGSTNENVIAYAAPDKSLFNTVEVYVRSHPLA
jgi:hypothetical protein